MALPSTVTVPVVVDDIGFIRRWTRVSLGVLAAFGAALAVVEVLALDGGAAKAGAAHINAAARATARRLKFMGSFQFASGGTCRNACCASGVPASMRFRFAEPIGDKSCLDAIGDRAQPKGVRVLRQRPPHPPSAARLSPSPLWGEGWGEGAIEIWA